MPDPGTKAMFARRLKPGKKKVVQREFEELVRDLGYESLLGSPAMKAYLFEFFVGGWGAKTRHMKRKEKKK